MRQWTIDYRQWTKRLVVVYGLWSIVYGHSFAQEPVPTESPAPIATSTFVVTLFDITRHDLYRLVTQTLKNAEGVTELIPARMQRGYIELNGKYTGDFAPIQTSAEKELGSQLKITMKTGTDGTKELSFYPLENTLTP